MIRQPWGFCLWYISHRGDIEILGTFRGAGTSRFYRKRRDYYSPLASISNLPSPHAPGGSYSRGKEKNTVMQGGLHIKFIKFIKSSVSLKGGEAGERVGHG